MRLPRLLALLGCITACAHAPHAPATVLRAGEVAVEYQPVDREVALQVVRALRTAVPAAERWGTLGPVTIHVHPTHVALERAARRPDHAWLRAWARRGSIELQSPRTWSRGAARDDEVAQLLAHELTHCVMYQVAGEQGGTIPLWFREGMASTSAGERLPPPSPGAVSLASLASALRTAPDLAYAASDAAFRALLQRGGDPPIRLLLRRLGAGRPFGQAFPEVMGLSVEAFEDSLDRLVVREGARG